MKMVFNVRKVSLEVDRDMHGRVVVATERYGTEAWDMRMDCIHEVRVMKVKCSRVYTK